MASSARRGGGERVLESRHLVGLFLGVVLLCGVFFTLGYVMGRQQYGGSVHAADATPLRSAPAASASAKNKEAAPPTSSTPGSDQGWDFYGKGNGAANDHLDSAPASRGKQPASSFAAKSSAKPAPPVAGKALPASAREPARFQPPALEQEFDRSAGCGGEGAARCAGNGRRDSTEKISVVCRYLVCGQSLPRADRPLPRYGRRGKRQARPRTIGL